MISSFLLAVSCHLSSEDESFALSFWVGRLVWGLGAASSSSEGRSLVLKCRVDCRGPLCLRRGDGGEEVLDDGDCFIFGSEDEGEVSQRADPAGGEETKVSDTNLR